MTDQEFNHHASNCLNMQSKKQATSVTNVKGPGLRKWFTAHKK
jgi:hypothetical protein